MKSKIPIIIILIIAIAICIVVITGNNGSILAKNETLFEDAGVLSDNNDEWINWNVTVKRNDNYTRLSGGSNSTSWYKVNKTINSDDFTIEWDSYGKPNNADFCLISNNDKSDTSLNFVGNLKIKKECHVKLVIKDKKITPYIDNVANEPIELKSDSNDLMFRFQINPNGSDICYSNFKIHET